MTAIIIYRSHLLNATITLLLISFSYSVHGQIDSLMRSIGSPPFDQEVIQAINDQLQSSLYQSPTEVLTFAKHLDSILISSDNQYAQAETKNTLGLSLYVNQRFDEAIEQLLASMRIFENLGRQDKIARLCNSLAIVYQVRKEPKTSALYWKKALSIYETLNDSLWVANVASNLGGHFMEHNQLTMADQLFEKACPIFEALGENNLLGYAKLNQGSLRVKQGRYQQAIKAFDQTFNLISYQANPLIHAVAHTGRGNAYLDLKQWGKAKDDLEKGYAISIDIGQYEQQVPAIELLSRYYEETGDYTKSIGLLKKRAVLQDSILSAEEDSRLLNALKKYETEKKEKEIELLSAENEIKDLQIKEKQRNLTFALLGVLSLAAFAFYFYQSRQKSNLLNSSLKNQKELLAKALTEKEFLLKEIHHRVKNNLQVISSLLKLQSLSIDDKMAQQALNESRSRVRSMSLIHQNLYQDHSNPSGIRIKEYINQLTREIFDTYNISPKNVLLSKEIEELTFDVDTVVPLGLIINELVTNSLKYAFQDDNLQGKIYLSIKMSKEKAIELNYQDNGIGFDLQSLNSKGFGLKIVDSFAERLNATFTLDGSQGCYAMFIIKDFKIAE